tara:strand:- start:2031 stop:2426 length:396 start_codon:yes stop_codon:yes gene_type:complete
MTCSACEFQFVGVCQLNRGPATAVCEDFVPGVSEAPLVMARTLDEGVSDRKLVMAIYKRFPADMKGLRNRKHRVLIDGPVAKKLGVEPGGTWDLEDQPRKRLEALAGAIRLRIAQPLPERVQQAIVDYLRG